MFGWSPVGVLRFFAKAFLVLGLLLGGVLIVSSLTPLLGIGTPSSPSFLFSTLLRAIFNVGGGVLIWAVLSTLAAIAMNLEALAQREHTS